MGINEKYEKLNNRSSKLGRYLGGNQNEVNKPIAYIDNLGHVWIRTKDDFYKRGRVEFDIRFVDMSGFKFIYKGEQIPEESKPQIQNLKNKKEQQQTEINPFDDLKYDGLE